MMTTSTTKQKVNKIENSCRTTNRSIKYRSKVQRITRYLDQFKACFAEGFPFVFGFSVYESFYDEQTSKEGKAHLPRSTGDKFLGGHDVLCVGYNDA